MKCSAYICNKWLHKYLAPNDELNGMTFAWEN